MEYLSIVCAEATPLLTKWVVFAGMRAILAVFNTRSHKDRFYEKGFKG